MMMELFYMLIVLLPGAIASFIIFKKISFIERMLFSFAFSISSLMIIFLNLNAFYNVPLSSENVLLVSLAVVLLLIVFRVSYLFARRKLIFLS